MDHSMLQEMLEWHQEGDQEYLDQPHLQRFTMRKVVKVCIDQQDNEFKQADKCEIPHQLDCKLGNREHANKDHKKKNACNGNRNGHELKVPFIPGLFGTLFKV